jgi:glycosyltransferase involved in cell wall biosynthesis
VEAALEPQAAPPVAAAPDAGVWIVIAAYNEGERLGETLRKLRQHYANVVVVDDGSRDDTGEVALGLPGVWVLRHIINCGQGAALQTGIDFALAQGAEYLVTFDADGQHSAEDIERLLAPVRSGAFDVALGSRFLGETVGMPRTRWLVLKLGVLFTRVFSRIRVTDTHNGLRALSRRAAGQIRITQNRMAHASEILDQIRQRGLRFTEVPVTIHYSSATMAKGQSSWNALKIVGQLLLGRFVR